MRYSLRLLLSGYHRNHLILLDLLWYCINFLHVAVKLMLMPRPQCRYRMKWSSVRWWCRLVWSLQSDSRWASFGAASNDDVTLYVEHCASHHLTVWMVAVYCYKGLLLVVPSLHPLEICRRGQSRFWPLTMLHSFIQNCCWITLQVSQIHIIKDERLLSFGGAYRLSLLGTGIVECLEFTDEGVIWNSLMAWPDWPWPPSFTRGLCHWDTR